MFVKALVLDREDFESLIADLTDAFMDDYRDEVKSGKVDDEDVKDYFAASFEEMLRMEGVSEIIVFFTNKRDEAVEITRGYTFVRYAEIFAYVSSVRFAMEHPET
jgi:hypothetical protein